MAKIQIICVYLCGGSCIEDVTTHLMKHLSLHPTLRTCSADTILRTIEELTCKNASKIPLNPIGCGFEDK